MNMPGLVLPLCHLVEIWADTSGSAPAINCLQETTDRIPGLAHTFLAAGATYVLDLAWPIHDMVKALLCERFGILLRTTTSVPSLALPEAMRGVERLLSELNSARPLLTSIQGVLNRIDDARRTFARQKDLPPHAIVPFALLEGRPSLHGTTADELLDEICHPVHLAAIRIWG